MADDFKKCATNPSWKSGTGNVKESNFEKTGDQSYKSPRPMKGGKKGY